jgi:hypothetical protein
MARGANLTGTEAPELLVKEYELARHALAAAASPGKTDLGLRYARLSKRLLEERDKDIARHVNQTLGEGETGLIFLGMLHALESHLAPDIRPVRLSDLSKGGACQSAAPP